MANLSRAGTCAEHGCAEPIHAKRMCKAHYSAWYRKQNPDKIERYNARRRKPDPHVPPPCSVEGCTAKHYARGHCKRHYRQQPDQQAREREYYADPRVQARRRNVDKRRQRRPYQRAWEDARKDWGAWWEQHRMREDLADIAAWEQRQARRQRRITRATKPLSPPRQWVSGNCPGCDASVTVIRGWWHDSIYCPACTKRKWQMNHRQRARHYGVAYEFVNDFEVFAADGHRCQICNRPTRGKHPNPLAATLDHIIPMSRGGPHLRHNLQTAHKVCNEKKGNRAANDQLRLQLAA